MEIKERGYRFLTVVQITVVNARLQRLVFLFHEKELSPSTGRRQMDNVGCQQAGSGADPRAGQWSVVVSSPLSCLKPSVDHGRCAEPLSGQKSQSC